MSSTNQSPAYQKAQGKFLQAQTDEEKIEALEEMIRECPKHKSSENMLANLKTRYKKLKSKIEKSKKKGTSKKGIKKEDMQAVIIGLTNSGKSKLLTLLTNAKPTISEIKFSTIRPVIGMMKHAGTQTQLIENPAIFSEYYDKGLTNSADSLLILITNLNQIKDIDPLLDKSQAKKIIVFNNFNKTKEELRKINATLKSRRYDYVIIDIKNCGGDGQGDGGGLDQLKEKIFQSFDNIRVYTKEPGKEKSPKPIILKPDSTIKDVAEKILHGFSKQVKEIKIWGPSSKFAGQKVGLKHKLKDLDIVEFKTR